MHHFTQGFVENSIFYVLRVLESTLLHVIVKLLEINLFVFIHSICEGLFEVKALFVGQVEVHFEGNVWYRFFFFVC